MAYNDSTSLKTYLCVMRNCLEISSMDHNQIPSFLLCEAGIQVNEKPKHQADILTVKYHSIYNDETKFRIHLQMM